MSQFLQPGISNPDDKLDWAENKGALLLFFPTGIQHGVKSVHGEADAIQAKVVRLNDGRVWENGLVFPSALVTQLKGAIPDGMVLGTLDQGENRKGNPPWLLRPHTEAEVARAEAWLAANPRNQFAQPQEQKAPPTAPAWGQQATAPAAPAWGQQAPAPVSAPPATGGWGAPPAAPPAQQWGGPAPADVNPAAAGWGAPAAPPVAPPAPAGPDLNAIAAQLTARGVQIPPGTTPESLLAVAAMHGIQG